MYDDVIQPATIQGQRGRAAVVPQGQDLLDLWQHGPPTCLGQYHACCLGWPVSQVSPGGARGRARVVVLEERAVVVEVWRCGKVY